MDIIECINPFINTVRNLRAHSWTYGYMHPAHETDLKRKVLLDNIKLKDELCFKAFSYGHLMHAYKKNAFK